MPPSRVSLPAAASIAAFSIPFLVPWHTLPIATFYGEWISGVLGVALIVILTLWQRNQDNGKSIRLVPWIAVAPAWLIATTLLQSVTGMPDVTGARFVTQMTLALGTVLTIATWHAGQCMSVEERGKIVDSLAIAFVIAGVLGALAQWTQVFRLEPRAFGLVSSYFIEVDRRPWGNLNQPNHQATVDGLALAASIWLATRGKLRWPTWIMVALVIESGLILSGSRLSLVFVGLSVVYALMAAAYAWREDTEIISMPRVKALIAAAVIMPLLFGGLGVAIHTASQVLGWTLVDAYARIGNSDQMGARSPLWWHALAMFREHPWLGVGYGEFGWEQFQQMAKVGTRAAMTLHAHNALLDMLAKTGIVGTAGVVLALSTWLWRVVCRRLIAGGRMERDQTVIIFVWLAVLGAHAMLEYPLHHVYFFLPLCFMLGWLDTAGFGDDQRFARRVTVVAFAAMATVALGIAWQDYGRLEDRGRAGPEHMAALPMPTVWFDTYGRVQLVQNIVITPANAAKLVQFQLEAVHLLPTPTAIRRMAWLYALTGKEDYGRLWLERLHYYTLGDEARQFAKIDTACGEIEVPVRPRDFCAWAQTRSTSRGD